MDGLSTRDAVTEVSGRGVGLGAVRAACVALGGRIVLATTLGRGTTWAFHFDAAAIDCVAPLPSVSESPLTPAPPAPGVGNTTRMALPG